MALQITGLCVNCYACQPLCYSAAIIAAQPHFQIDTQRCQECHGAYAEPQCASICPIEAAIVDDRGVALNPLGSLTGMPPAQWAAAKIAI